MAERWLADSTTTKLLYYTENDDLVVADTVAYLVSLIRTYDPPGANGRIQAQATFNTTDGYKPPADAGYLEPYDTSTELGQKQEAAQALHDSLIAAREAIMQVAPEKIQAHVQRLLEFEAMGHWANYVAAHMTSITNAQFIAWAGKMSLGPDGVTSLQTLFEQVHDLADDKIPQEACAWVDPADADEVVALDVARNSSTQDGNGNAWFEGETVDLYDVDLGNGAWIRELTS